VSTKKFVESRSPATHGPGGERRSEHRSPSALAQRLRNGFDRGLLTLLRASGALRIAVHGAEAAINGSFA